MFHSLKPHIQYSMPRARRSLSHGSSAPAALSHGRPVHMPAVRAALSLAASSGSLILFLSCLLLTSCFLTLQGQPLILDKLLILLPQLPDCWDYDCAGLFVLLGYLYQVKLDSNECLPSIERSCGQLLSLRSSVQNSKGDYLKGAHP